MTTLRDALETAFNDAPETESIAVESAPAGEVVAEATEVAETASEKAERIRDESGRFAKAEEKTEEAAQEVAAEVKPPRKAPSSWKKDYWGAWEKLGTDPELATLQDYVEQRESEFAKGVSTYREEAMRAKDLQDAIAPFVPVLQQHGMAPAETVRNVMSAHHALVTGSPEQKANILRQLATSYGVPVQALAGGQVDQQQFQVLNEINSLKQQLGSFQQTAQQREAAEAAQRIEAFKSNASHFEDVREPMARLLQSGFATDLQDAYEKAVRLDPAVWERVQSEKAQTQLQAAAKTVASKKATAVSPRSSAPTGRVAVAGGNDIRSALGAAFEQYSAGRF